MRALIEEKIAKRQQTGQGTPGGSELSEWASLADRRDGENAFGRRRLVRTDEVEETPPLVVRRMASETHYKGRQMVSRGFFVLCLR